MNAYGFDIEAPIASAGPNSFDRMREDAVTPGEVIARTKGIFGRFRQDYVVPVAGTIESISAVTGQNVKALVNQVAERLSRLKAEAAGA